MAEIMKNKREFNARARELVADGYKKTRESDNYHLFRKHIYAKPDLMVKLVKGWKKNG